MMSPSNNSSGNTSTTTAGVGTSVHGGGRISPRSRPQLEHRLQRYDLWRSRPLGTGAYAIVVPARHRLTGHRVAVKIVPRMTGEVQREIKILRLLQHHPHVIRFYEAIVDTDEQVYIVMERAESGELHDRVVACGKLEEGEARRVFQQIVAAVAYCHRNMVVHHDIKLDNILLDSRNNVRIADFGFSRFFSHNDLVTSNRGSLSYAAPELLKGTEHVGPEVDVWSCGVALFAMLCGRLPFDGPDDSQVSIRRRILSGKLRIPSNLSDQSRDLISRMLRFDSSKRMTIDEVREHPWLQFPIPRYLLPPAPPLDAANIFKVDDETVREVLRIGCFDENTLLQSLQNRVENEATVVYYLRLDKRFDARSPHFWTEHEETTAIALLDARRESAAGSRQQIDEHRGSRWREEIVDVLETGDNSLRERTIITST